MKPSRAHHRGVVGGRAVRRARRSRWRCIVEALDRMNLLRDVTVILSEMGANVLSCTTSSHRDGMVEMRFLFQVSDISHIDLVLKKLRSVDGVFDARRMVAGKAQKRNEPATFGRVPVPLSRSDSPEVARKPHKRPLGRRRRCVNSPLDCSPCGTRLVSGTGARPSLPFFLEPEKEGEVLAERFLDRFVGGCLFHGSLDERHGSPALQAVPIRPLRSNAPQA